MDGSIRKKRQVCLLSEMMKCTFLLVDVRTLFLFKEFMLSH